MLKRTTYEYDIHHRGDEIERLEILHMLATLADIISNSNLAEVEVSSEKIDLICVKIHKVESP
jgi:hypothetical protein